MKIQLSVLSALSRLNLDFPTKSIAIIMISYTLDKFAVKLKIMANLFSVSVNNIKELGVWRF